MATRERRQSVVVIVLDKMLLDKSTAVPVKNEEKRKRNTRVGRLNFTKQQQGSAHVKMTVRINNNNKQGGERNGIICAGIGNRKQIHCLTCELY